MTATQVVTGPATLVSVVINVSSLYTVAIADGTASASTLIGTIAKSATSGDYEYNCAIANGIRITTTSTGGAGIVPDVTVIYRQ